VLAVLGIVGISEMTGFKFDGYLCPPAILLGFPVSKTGIKDVSGCAMEFNCGKCDFVCLRTKFAAPPPPPRFERPPYSL
jgi:hypothetical protein